MRCQGRAPSTSVASMISGSMLSSDARKMRALKGMTAQALTRATDHSANWVS